jgi:hypothetical protein
MGLRPGTNPLPFRRHRSQSNIFDHFKLLFFQNSRHQENFSAKIKKKISITLSLDAGVFYYIYLSRPRSRPLSRRLTQFSSVTPKKFFQFKNFTNSGGGDLLTSFFWGKTNLRSCF